MSPAPSAEPDRPSTEAATPDAVIAGRIAPLLAAAVLSLLPFTVFSTFLVPISVDTAGSGADPVGVGALRGLGGIGALVVGFVYAPVVDRFAKGRSIAVALALLAVAALVATLATVPALIAFALATGVATAVLGPTLNAAAGDRFAHDVDSARAATMVTATTTLAAVLAGPVVGGLALAVGWRGVFAVIAALALAAAVASWLRPGVATGAGAGWLGSVRDVLGNRRVLALVLVSGLRTAAFMGALSVAAAAYAERHGLAAEAFTLVWTVSGLSFFIGNWWIGRALARGLRPAPVLAAGVTAAVVAVVLVFLGDPLWVAVTGTALLAVGHAIIAACVTTLLVRDAGRVRGAAFGFNGVAQSAGVFVGAAVAAGGHALAGWAGAAIALGTVTLLAGLAGAVAIAGRRRAG